MSGRVKEIIARTLLVLAGTTVGIYGCELVFRAFALSPSVPRTEAQFERMVASHWPRAISSEKAAGTIRILGLADSFGLAGGAHNYHYLLEKQLRRRGHPVEVVNFSVAAYSLDEELALLRRFAARFKPDLVLHGFFIGNDFAVPQYETMRFCRIKVDLIPGLTGWRPDRLLLAQWLQRWRIARRDAALREGQEEGTFSKESFLRVERVRFSVCRVPETDGPAWLRTTYFLDAIKKEVEKLGALHVLVAHPDQFQVEPALAEEVVRTYELQADLYDLDLPRRFLHAYAGARDIPLVDVTPTFRRYGAEGGLYIPLDTHYNEQGNRIAADVIAQVIDPLLARTVSER